MKKSKKKLVLAKETVRSLETSALRDVAVIGASGEYACNPLTGMSCRYCLDEPIGPA
ncbi:MAG TPA: class I lanthipeptide [Thermoanaerobaculia bacterium]|nr:class I lanthipeptide [Thermoanaerobaculia bacterium]